MITDKKTELIGDKIRVTTIEEKDRYTGRVVYDQANVDLEIEDFKANNKCWTKENTRNGFDCLDTGEDWEPRAGNLSEDLTHFQLYLDKTYGKGEYEAFALGAYIHSGVSFSISKSEDNRCHWDSGTIGFIGIPKCSVDYWNKREHGINEYAHLLSDMWNGELGEICVYDNYNEEVVDSCWTTDPIAEINEWKAQMKEQYGVDNFDEEINY